MCIDALGSPVLIFNLLSLFLLTLKGKLTRIDGLFLGGVPERSKGPDCKSGGSAFAGSNPAPSSTIIEFRLGRIFEVLCGLPFIRRCQIGAVPVRV